MLQVPLSPSKPFYESPLSVVERFQKIQFYADEAGELRLKKSEDHPEALEEHKRAWRDSWANSRLNRGYFFTGYPGCINVRVQPGRNDWELWKNILKAENDWVQKQWAARVKRHEEPNELEPDPKRQRTMSTDPTSIFAGIPLEVICTPATTRVPAACCSSSSSRPSPEETFVALPKASCVTFCCPVFSVFKMP